jgi:hypothetical protein
MEKAELVDALKRYSSVVIWGLREPTTSTQRHVHRHMFMALEKIGCNAIWCENTAEDNIYVQDGSLVISSNECCSNIQYRKANWYAFCHIPFAISECQNYLNLYVYGNSELEAEGAIWDETTILCKANHRLYQAFGTDLLPEEFSPPVYNTDDKFYWVGSIWNDKNGHGNLSNIELLRDALKRHKIQFMHLRNVSDEENRDKIRSSRIAPAIGGIAQTKAMMPCRIWKNISYGQLGITNLAKSIDVFGSNVVYDSDIDILIDKALSIGEKAYKEMTAEQQKIVAEEHTYLNWIFNIVRAFEELGAL